MKLSCEWLAADLPQDGGHVDHIVAETNVVIDFADESGQTIHATGEKAVYVYEVQNGATNETVTLTGNRRVGKRTGHGSPANRLYWDRANNRLAHDEPKDDFATKFERRDVGNQFAGGNDKQTGRAKMILK